MSYTLTDLCADCRRAIAAQRGPEVRAAVRTALGRLLANREFVEEHCGPALAGGVHVLHHERDAAPGEDFMVLVHAYDKGRASPPHDHGPSWAVYGQAAGWTDMTVWKRLDDGSVEGRAKLEPARRWRLEAGDVGAFEPGDIHTVSFPDGARFVRVTGTDLNAVPTRAFDLEKGTVRVAEPMKSPGAERGVSYES